MALRERSLRCLLASMLAGVTAAVEGMSFTVHSRPVKLRYAQVYNNLQYDASEPIFLPKDVIERYAKGDKVMAITGFDVDMVRISSDGAEVKVGLDDHYLHHYALYFGEKQAMDEMMATIHEDRHLEHMFTGCHAMKGAGVRMLQSRARKHKIPDYKTVSFGSAAGSEYRDNPQRFQEPYRVLLHQPEVWAPLLHIINTNNATRMPGFVSPLLECPCTPQRKFDLENGTIDGKPADPPIQCSREFAATGNPSCHLSTYIGGWRCCEHKVFLVDTDKECEDAACSAKPEDEVQMKFTFYYEDAQPAVRKMEPGACCDVTSDTPGFENIEYDVPKCAEGTPAEKCLHVAENLQEVGYHERSSPSPYGADDLVDLVFVAPHLHWAALSISLIDPETNRTLCEVHRTEDNSAGLAYGNGTAPGSEGGYLTGLTPCTWSSKDAPRFRRKHLLRTRAVYNASALHTGVMSLWLSQVSPVEPDILV